MLDLQDTRLFPGVSFFPFQLILFFDLFFFPAFAVLFQETPPPPPPPPRSGHFYLLGNPLIMIKQSINASGSGRFFRLSPSFKAEEQECRHAGRLGSHDCVSTRGYAIVLRQGNVMETDTPTRRGYECQSCRTFENFLSNAQLRGAFSSTFTRSSLVRPPQSY